MIQLPIRRAQLGAWLGSGTSVVLGSVVISNMLRIVSSVVLTRLLNAEAFGVVGFVASVTFVMAMLSDVGIFPFIVRHERGSDPVFLDEVWTVRLIRAFLLAALMVALSWPVAAYAGKPALQPVLAVSSLTYVLEGLSSLSFATAVRGQEVRRISVLEIVVAVLQIGLAILFALLTRSYWAMVYSGIVSNLIKAGLSYAMFPGSLRRFRLSPERFAEMWRFSRFIALSSVLTVLIMHSDKLLFVRLLTLQQFGLYAIATSLAVAPMAVVSPYSHRILYPAYARGHREAPETLAALFYRQRRLVTLLYMLAVGGLIGVAPLLVRILYDPRYLGVAPYLQILAISSMLAMPTWAADQMIVATGRPSITFWGNVARIGWLAAGVIVALAAKRPILIVWAVGTAELAAYLFYARELHGLRLLRLREELAGVGAGLIGAAIGTGVSLGAIALAAANGVRL